MFKKFLSQYLSEVLFALALLFFLSMMLAVYPGVSMYYSFPLGVLIVALVIAYFEKNKYAISAFLTPSKENQEEEEEGNSFSSEERDFLVSKTIEMERIIADSKYVIERTTEDRKEVRHAKSRLEISKKGNGEVDKFITDQLSELDNKIQEDEKTIQILRKRIEDAEEQIKKIDEDPKSFLRENFQKDWRIS